MYWRKYLAAWLTDWAGRMSGIASVLLTFWATFFPPNAHQAKWALIVVAIACFILGSYHIWAREYKALLEEHGNKLLPDLHGNMDVMVGELSVKNVFIGTHLTLFLTIHNVGTMPSVCKDWKLLVDLHHESIEAIPYIFDGEMDLAMLDSFPHTINSRDRIDVKVSETPIPVGGTVNGYLMYLVRGLRKESIDVEGARVRLEYSDIKDGQYIIVRPMGQTHNLKLPLGMSPYLPGINLKPAIQNKQKRKKPRRR